MTKNDIFRFVSLRNVQTISQEKINENYFPGIEDSPIIDAAKDCNVDVLNYLIDAFVRSDRFITSFINSKGILKKISHVFAAIKKKKITSSEEFYTIVNHFIDKVDHHEIEGLEKNLWESLYVSIIRMSAFKHDRADIINALRLIQILQWQSPQEITLKDILSKLKANPIIPTFILEKCIKVKPDNTAPNPTPGTIDPRVSIERLKKKVDDLHHGTLEIEKIERKKSFELDKRQKENKKKKTPKKNLTISEIDNENIEAETGNILKFDWRLTQVEINNLSETAKAIISDLNIDPKIDTTQRMIKSMENDLIMTYNLLYQDSGIRYVSPIGKNVSSGYNKTKSVSYDVTMHEAGLFDPTHNLPPIVVNEAKYNHSIKTSLGTVKPLGMGDLLVVKESLLKYEMGEIAFIENIMKGENKERVYRRLDRQEESYTTTTESTEETERDLQISDRYELQIETQKTIESSMDAEAGATFSAKYGPVSISANASFSVSNSQSESQTTASNYAKEIVDKTITRITESLKEEIIKKTLLEIEETNTHGFDNQSENHINGIYRWVDKYYLAEIYNYGQRLMMEFVVPEPAALYIHSKATKTQDGITIPKPKDLEDDFSFQTITPFNYHTYVRDYKVKGVSVPPRKYVIISTAINEPMTDKPTFSGKDESKEFYTLTSKVDATLMVPEGYEAKEAFVSNAHTSLFVLDGAMDSTKDSFDSDEESSFRLIVGQSVFELTNYDEYRTMNDEDGPIPIALRAFNILAYAITVEVKCERTDKKLDAWKIETYDLIIEAYNVLNAEYITQVNNATASATSYNFGASPDAKRKIEKEELKRGCITLLTDQHFKDFNAVDRNATTYGYPEIDVYQAMLEKNEIVFFEQAFEWSQMVYTYYPYYWGNKTYWMDLMNMEDADPEFDSFLKAGAARVIVPVREGLPYVSAVTYYLETGDIWNGGEMPVIGDELYLSIIDEIKANEDISLTNAIPTGEMWEVKLPTSLVLLQADDTLPDNSIALNYPPAEKPAP